VARFNPPWNEHISMTINFQRSRQEETLCYRSGVHFASSLTSKSICFFPTTGVYDCFILYPLSSLDGFLFLATYFGIPTLVILCCTVSEPLKLFWPHWCRYDTLVRTNHSGLVHLKNGDLTWAYVTEPLVWWGCGGHPSWRRILRNAFQGTFCIRFWIVHRKRHCEHTNPLEFLLIFNFIFLPTTKISGINIIDGINQYEVYFLQEYLMVKDINYFKLIYSVAYMNLPYNLFLKFTIIIYIGWNSMESIACFEVTPRLLKKDVSLLLREYHFWN